MEVAMEAATAVLAVVLVRKTGPFGLTRANSIIGYSGNAGYGGGAGAGAGGYGGGAPGGYGGGYGNPSAGQAPSSWW